MKVIVLGAGVVGVSTAYYLARGGHRVTVIDRQLEPGLETSYANGGQISASHATPWANPATLRKLVSWLGRKNAPLSFRLRWDADLWAFFLRFLFNCRGRTSRANALKVLRLALYSREQLQALRAETSIEFEARDKGILHLYRSGQALDAAARTAESFRALGLDTQDLNVAACVKLEPALAAIKDELTGGIYSPGDVSGNARLFTAHLAEECTRLGVEFRTDTKVLRLTQTGGRITDVVTHRGVLTAERYVMALGSYSPQMLNPLGIRIPIYPAKGYSATVPVTGSKLAPLVSLTDDDAKIVMSRLGDKLRIAGMADFVGYDTLLDETRARGVLNAGARLFPDALDLDGAELWTGLRPLTPDGVPVIGATRYPNLFLNTGHGTLGWTLACGSARAVADLVTGQDPEIELMGYRADRF